MVHIYLKSHIYTAILAHMQKYYLCRRKNKDAETTISIVGRARVRIALDSYW